MYIFKPILEKNWENTGKNDAKRIASQTEPAGLRQILDIPYINDGHKGHLLDIYYPEGTTEKLPVIIDIHGGGWMYGYKEINKYFCLKLAQKGFLVASINYRLAGEVLFDDQIRDIFAALTWLGKNLKDYPADMDNIFLAGDSAGGHFVCVTTAINLNEDMQKDFGVEYVGYDFKAVSAICPAIDLLSPNFLMNVNVPVLLGDDWKNSKFKKYMKVENLVSSKFPPFHILTAQGDGLLKKQAPILADIFRKNNVDFRFCNFTGQLNGKYLGHVFNVVDPFSIYGEQANTDITDFFKSKM